LGGGGGVRWGLGKKGGRVGGNGGWGMGDGGWEGGDTFGCVGGLVLAPVSEDFVFDPGHVAGVGFVVLLLRPFRHDCGIWGVD